MTEKTSIKIGVNTQDLKSASSDIDSFRKVVDRMTQSLSKATQAKKIEKPVSTTTKSALSTPIPPPGQTVDMSKTFRPIQPGSRKIEPIPDDRQKNVKPLPSIRPKSIQADNEKTIEPIASSGRARLPRVISHGVSSLASGMGLSVPAVGMLGAAGATIAALSWLGSGIKKSKEYQLALDGLVKTFHMSRDAQSHFSNQVKSTAHELGLSRGELVSIEKQYISIAGAIKGLASVQDSVKTSGDFAKGLGLDIGQTVNQFGRLHRSGAYGDFAAKKDGLQIRDFAVIVADAVSKGQMKGREAELIQSIQSLVGVQMQALTKPQNIPGMVGTMTALNQTQEPGLMGAAGAGLMAKIDNAIRNPGGKMGEYLAYSAIGEKDFFKSKYVQEQGAWGENSNFEKIMKFYQKNFGHMNKYARWDLMSRAMPGVSRHQIEALEPVFSKMPSKQAGRFNRDLIKAAGGEKNLDRFDFSKIGILADISNVKGVKDIRPILEDPRLNFNQDKISKIVSAEDPRIAAMKEVFSANVQPTDGEATKTELAKIGDTLTGISDKILPEGIRLLKNINTGVDKISGFFDFGEAKTTDSTKPGKPLSWAERNFPRYAEVKAQRENENVPSLPQPPSMPTIPAYLLNPTGTQGGGDIVNHHEIHVHVPGQEPMVEKRVTRSRSAGNGNTSYNMMDFFK